MPYWLNRLFPRITGWVAPKPLRSIESSKPHLSLSWFWDDAHQTGWRRGQKLKRGFSNTFSGAPAPPPPPPVVILILSVAQEQQEEREEESEARHFIDVYLAEMEKNPKDFSFEELCRFEVFIASSLPSSWQSVGVDLDQSIVQSIPCISKRVLTASSLTSSRLALRRRQQQWSGLFSSSQSTRWIHRRGDNMQLLEMSNLLHCSNQLVSPLSEMFTFSVFSATLCPLPGRTRAL